MTQKVRVSSGVSQLDRLLGGLFIGDNVVWHDDSGNLAVTFCLNFLQTSLLLQKPVIYVSFDRSPKNLLDKLGALAESADLTILDAFTCGKGASSPIFMKFYEEPDPERVCSVKRMEKPRDTDYVMETIYGLHETMQGDVRLIFESMTGMQKIWGGEEAILKFYSHSCPRLYELDTIAYWIMEKLAHSQQLRAQINQIAQVAIDLSIKRGTTTLKILKAENRGTEDIREPHRYWTKDLTVTFEGEKHGAARLNLGLRIKELRTKRGLSQAELAKLVGVTPSTISQVEANIIYPSLPALLKMAEVLSVDITSLFEQAMELEKRIIFPAAEAVSVGFPDLPKGSLEGYLLTPLDFDGKMEPYLIEIMPNKHLPAHFFIHKGEEIGYLLSGKLRMSLNKATYTVRAGDVIYLTSEMPSQWRNPGPNVARLLWIKSR
ncbi:MAG: helix-turn-helix domain-containing protein [Deltaproteobacteria bacterium]|nr:helix-turn-helix domain-containing protein [Deltaproteobacteria bacterium]